MTTAGHTQNELAHSDSTCLNCGKPLRYETEDVWARVESSDGFRSKPTGERVRSFDKPGYHGNGKFCTLRCGFRWAVRHA